MLNQAHKNEPINRILSGLLAMLVVATYAAAPLVPLSIVSAEEGSSTPATASSDESGQDGEDGEADGGAAIQTGDAGFDATVENTANTNKTQEGEEDNSFTTTTDPVYPEEGSSEDEDSNASSSPEEIAGQEDGTASPAPSAATSSGDYFENINQAQTDNTLDAEAGTGSNSLTGGASSTATSTIGTGDIDGRIQVSNQANTNDLDADCGGDCAAATGTVTQTQNQNSASTSNQVNVDGQTGSNLIASSGPSVITTGDINLLNIILNYLNNNFLGQGREYLVNILDYFRGDVDLSGYGQDAGGGGSGGGWQVDNTNASSLENILDVAASTGSNTISGASGSVAIQTGDIDISNHIFNFVNNNIAGQDWFFAVVNVFDVLEGDVLLPAWQESGREQARNILASAEMASTSPVGNLLVTNNNESSTSNQVVVDANTGNNRIASSGAGSVIQTGDAITRTHAFNIINYNYVGNKWRLLRINVFGDWQGIIQGLPEGYDYFQDEYGITVYQSPDSLADCQDCAYSVRNDNYASTTNRIRVEADTGSNSILHGADGSSIRTGSINVSNSLMNFINSNFTGNDWEFSMVNVFGEWQGDLAFGRPELWITRSESRQDKVGPGEYVTVNFLFGNNGDAKAHNVAISEDYAGDLLEVFAANDGQNSKGELNWKIGDLPPNTQGSLSYRVRVKDNIPPGEMQARNVAAIRAEEPDRDDSNNKAAGILNINGGASQSSEYRIANTARSHPGLRVIKTNDADGELGPGDEVNFRISIANSGSEPLKDVLVLDILTQLETEEEMNREFWNLGTVQAGEQIYIDYTVRVGGQITTGTYLNEVTVEGLDEKSGGYIPTVASSKIKVNNDQEEEPRPSPSLTLGLISRQPYANPGDKAVYELIVANNGTAVASSVVLTQYASPSLEWLGGAENYSRQQLGELKPGDIKNLPYTIWVKPDTKAGKYGISSVISAANHADVVHDSEIEVRTIRVLASRFDSGAEAAANSELDSKSGQVQQPQEQAIRLATDPSGGNSQPETPDSYSQSKELIRSANAHSPDSIPSGQANPEYGSMSWLGILLVLLLIYLLMRYVSHIAEKKDQTTQ